MAGRGAILASRILNEISALESNGDRNTKGPAGGHIREESGTPRTLPGLSPRGS